MVGGTPTPPSPFLTKWRRRRRAVLMQFSFDECSLSREKEEKEEESGRRKYRAEKKTHIKLNRI